LLPLVRDAVSILGQSRSRIRPAATVALQKLRQGHLMDEAPKLLREAKALVRRLCKQLPKDDQVRREALDWLARNFASPLDGRRKYK
jgi:hypothetical protein